MPINHNFTSFRVIYFGLFSIKPLEKMDAYVVLVCPDTLASNSSNVPLRAPPQQSGSTLVS